MISRRPHFRLVTTLVLSLTACLAAAESPRAPTAAHTPLHPAELYDPVAQPRSVVKAGHARFTVLTPRLIRMEWADGKFEDHPSLVFLNRNLPVPKFTTAVTKSGTQDLLTLKTSALTLTYAYSEFGSDTFTADDLHVEFELNGQTVTWHPGLEDTENLQGTTRTLDGALGGKTKEPIGPGLISRAGWVLVDDSTRPLFDSDDFRLTASENSPWPWVMQRPAGDRQDWYFFGYGHDYKQALGDFIKVAGPIPLPPRLVPGGRVTGAITTRSWMSWCAASSRTQRRWMCWSSTWTGTARMDRCFIAVATTPAITRLAGVAIAGIGCFFRNHRSFLPTSMMRA
jgi:hypothetical protein